MQLTQAPTESNGEAAGDVGSPDGAPHAPDFAYLDGSVATSCYELQDGLAALDHHVVRGLQASKVHEAVLNAGLGRHKLAAPRPMEKDKPYLVGMVSVVVQHLSGRGFESMTYKRWPLLTTPADFRLREVQLPVSAMF